MFHNVKTINPNEFAADDFSVSPFAVYSEERIDKEQRTFVATTPTALDRIILETINNLCFVTSALLHVHLTVNLGLDMESSTLQRRLRQLTGAQFLSAYRFKTVDGKHSSHLAYCLCWRGTGFLKANGILPNRMAIYVASIADDPTAVKKILSTAQVVVRTNISLPSTHFCQPIFIPSKDPTRKASKIFRPQAFIQTKTQTVFLEAVRQNTNWETEVLDKLSRMDAVFKSRQEANVFLQNPAVILIAESSSHMQMLLRMLERSPISFPVYFTADPIVYSTPTACLHTLKKKSSFWASLFAS